LNVALPALEVSKKLVMPGRPSDGVTPVLLNTVMLPAVALFLNAIVPAVPELSVFVVNCWTTPELFVMPTPLSVSVTAGLAAMKKEVGCGSELNTISLTSVSAEIETWAIEDEPNVAMSAGPLGTVIGDQLAAVFQSPLTGVVSQVLLPAKAESATKNMSMVAAKRWRAHGQEVMKRTLRRTRLIA
jgi:hypothetical protein